MTWVAIEVWVRRFLVEVVLVVCFVGPLVGGTPFPFPGRPLDGRHKQMHVYGDNGAQNVQLSTLSTSAGSTFSLSDGDSVWCIPVENQQSLSQFSNPKIQMKPTKRPASGSYGTSDGTKTAFQVFTKEAKCPKGQIPVRRARNPSTDNANNGSAQDVGVTSGTKRKYIHQHAYTATPISRPPSYKGTQVVMNVWQPFVEPRDFSLAQLWVMNTGLSFTPGSDNWAMNSLEVGWQVYSDLYGDMLPRLFVYWTGDGYVKTGCYNLNQDCPAGSPGFVQVSNKVLLGGSISPPSEADSDQYEIKLRVFKDEDSGNWWLQFNQEYVGYWPSYLFHSLRDTSDLIQWGGEVFDVREGDAETKTHMGSGAPSTSGFGKAAYQRNLQYVDFKDNKFYDAHDLQAVSTNPSCYSVSPESSEAWGSHFFYGGSC
ncbi:hypothetical protein KC19_5G094400 [Ceratodon purpureus]|uniref:Neprosin PEP catalytic domain-containing protein n=1 Tax=Ceratodon purpureus TaxID=3225 RepID=A0A8T0I139_CERPU|nr:hypothetical protein KC19_5G094400 [Ceratodon purpureus]